MTRQLSASQMQALVRLLGDSDERTTRVARERLLAAGASAVPWLLSASTSEADPMIRGRARMLLEEVRVQILRQRLARLAEPSRGAFDLEEGLFVVARARYPELDEPSYRQQLHGMVEQLQRRRVARMHPAEAAAAINRYLFYELGFRNNEAHYYDPDNVCINHVLDRRVGVGLSLAALYLVVARPAGFPARAVSLPGRLVVEVPVMPTFWLDPSEGGRVLSRHDLIAMARESGHQFEESMLDAIEDREIIERILAHLLRIYALTSQKVAAERTEALLRVLSRASGDGAGPAAPSPVSREDSGG